MQTRQPELFVALSITWSFATLTLVLRLLCRRITKNRLWWDDYFAIIAYLLNVGVAGSMIKWTQDGFGLHMKDVPRPDPEILRDARIDLFILEIFYIPSLSFSKLAILAFYWRIFNSVRSAKISIIILAVIAVLWLAVRLVLNILHCIPVHAYWDTTVPGARCPYRDSSFYHGNVSLQYIHLLFDVALLIIPALQVQKLRLNRAKKFGLTALFMFGIFVCAATIAVIVYSTKYDPSTSDEFSWNVASIFIWTIAEVNLAIASSELQ
ncbi:hypothetical protein FJTKL_11961 [Diaporthe vaccinii]|uniref:Rhodopsin domain-containing protein n=1 Tax=Diaporthe vaccinii TaxID=105482 RepID=A0ABR4FAP2_9PEZI